MKRTDVPAPPLPPGRPRLVVTGFMGTGKTRAGGAASERLDLPFVDLDECAAARRGRPVDRIIDEEGEAAFRAIERRVLAEAAALSGTVVATGGGAPLLGEEFAALAEGAEVAVLTADPAEIARRLGDGSGRPLLRPNRHRRIAELLSERAPAYARAGDALVTAGRTIGEVGDELAERYRRRCDPASPVTIEVDAPGHGPAMIGRGVLRLAGAETAKRVPEARTAAVVIDPGAHRAGEDVADSMASAGLRVAQLSLPRGEAAKTLPALGDLLASLRQHGVEPNDVVVAVGGGAVLDAAGLAAATYSRGVALVNVPTTLLAMADAGLGGKVAIDHADVKNLMGTFHPPRLVVADPSILDPLPDRELRTGLAEVVKAAVLAAPLLIDLLDSGGLDIRMGWLVEQAVRIKAAYVAADPRDAGVRRSLNLGHTFAHAIESSSGYRVAHGEAVACGLVAAARLGARSGVTEDGLAERLRSVLTRLGLPTGPPQGVGRDDLLRAMAGDKKRRSGRAVFVVPAAGGAALLEGIDGADALDSLMDNETARTP